MDGYFSVTFSPDPKDPSDYAFRWRGRPGTRGKAAKFATSAAMSAWRTFAAAHVCPDAPPPAFIAAAKYRFVRAEKYHRGAAWSISIDHFKASIGSGVSNTILPSLDSAVDFEFLASLLEFDKNEENFTLVDVGWDSSLFGKIDFRAEKLKLLDIMSDIRTYSEIRQNYDYSVCSNAMNVIVFCHALTRKNNTNHYRESYVFIPPSKSATMRAIKSAEYQKVLIRLDSFFRSQGNVKIASHLNVLARRTKV